VDEQEAAVSPEDLKLVENGHIETYTRRAGGLRQVYRLATSSLLA